MPIQKIGCVIRWFELHVSRVTKFATVGRIDLIVAHQAIGHARHRCFRYGIRFVEPAMTGRARIRATQVRPLVAQRGKERFGIDRSRQQRRDIPESQVLDVTEVRDRRAGRRRNRHFFVTAHAHFFLG